MDSCEYVGYERVEGKTKRLCKKPNLITNHENGVLFLECIYDKDYPHILKNDIIQFE